MAIEPCLWCETSFEPRRGGSRQRFCRARHRIAFHTAARLWAERALDSGVLTLADIRNGTGEPCTLLLRGQSPFPLSDIGYDEPVLSEARCATARDMVLDIPITAEGLIELCRLGWLDPEKLRNSKAVADAVVDLSNAAISARLQPSA